VGHDHEFFTVDAPPDTDAINGRLEHLRGTALGFRDLANYIAYVEFDISDGMSTAWLC